MHIHFILIIIFCGYLRRILQTKKNDPHLDKLLWYGIALAGTLILLQIIFPATGKFTIWVGFLLLFYLIYCCFYIEKFQPARSFAIAFLPFLVLSFLEEIIKLVAPEFYFTWESYFNVIDFFAIIWLVAMLIVNNKQRKALLKERAKLEEKEKENEITRQLKAELEIQVAQRTMDIEQQKKALEKTVHELKTTQDQLIHAEKMASLGELTAGIAHEIKNPLNFVNNFSDVSKEMVYDMKTALDNGNIQEAKEFMSDIVQNLEKITYHGKRADAIVRSMLQHSRSGSGTKELTDVNDLADEYLRLAYHGLRAKDNSFHATFETQFDTSIEKINIEPQEIGRVLLNLINNAFYAVTDKKKQINETQLPEGQKYRPTVHVSTKKLNGKVAIIVRDNGNGIPDEIRDKVFQPFFTTKPTGSGIGLGLSLSYDIVKSHGGEIKVESKTGEGSIFSVILST